MRYLLALTAVAFLAGCSGQPVAPTQPLPTVERSIPPIVHEYHVVLIGDSYTAGSAEGGQRGRGWPALVARDLLNQHVLVSNVLGAEGSAAYISASSEGHTFGDIARRVVGRDGELVVFFGGSNDVVVPPERVGPAALDAFTSAKAAAPAATLMVIGPVWPGSDPPAAFLNVRDAVRHQVQSIGGAFVDPIAEGWLADTPELIGADQFHPTDEGHKYLAARIAPLIRDALKQRGS
jgi:lysophospholipase L1-like esterase